MFAIIKNCHPKCVLQTQNLCTMTLGLAFFSATTTVENFAVEASFYDFNAIRNSAAENLERTLSP